MPKILDPKEKWERRRENWASRQAVHQSRESRLEEFKSAPKKEAEMNAQVAILLSSAELPKVPDVPAVQANGKSGDVIVTLNLRGQPMEFKFRFRDLTGTFPASRLNHADLREMFAQALNTIARIE